MVLEEILSESTDIETADAFAALPPVLAAALRRRGFSELAAVQRAVIEAESSGRDLRISSQTGSGKTVAIGIALLAHLEERPATAIGPTALVIVPTRELAAQVREELHWLFAELPRIHTEVVTGGSDMRRECRALATRPVLVVGTPGRMLDHMRGGTLRCEDVTDVVLDEADRMLDMGFREELEAIVDQLPDERRSHLVSATFPTSLRGLADRFQRDPLHLEGTRLGAANQDIQHIAHRVERRDQYSALVNLLLLLQGERCLVFVQRRIESSQLAEKLAGDGFAVQAFSGELAQAQRTRTLNAFRQGALHTLISTDVAARGIDVPDISAVIHMDPPFDAESYVHRSGRTGRAGRKGQSIMLVPPRAERRVRRTLSIARVEVDWLPIPGAAKVRKVLEKRLRRDLYRLLVDPKEPPSEGRLEYASKLLEERDPRQLVAVLLDLAAPAMTCEPRNLGSPEPPSTDRGRGSDRGPGGHEGFMLFSVNWGERTGATVPRLLSHICRRGDLTSRHVGSIRIGKSSSTFEIAGSAAPRFEGLARRPDSRDPRVRIWRLDRRSKPDPKRKGPGSQRDGGSPRFRKPPRAKKRKSES